MRSGGDIAARMFPAARRITGVLSWAAYAGSPDGKPNRKISVSACGLCDPKVELDTYWKKMVAPQDSNQRESLKLHSSRTQMRDCGVGTFY